MTDKVTPSVESTPLAKARSNPWMVSTIVLGVLLIGFVIFSLAGQGITGAVVGSSTVSDNVVSYLNGKVGGGVTLDSVEKQNGYYKMIVNYNGQKLPVYATADGKNLISDLIPLDGSADAGDSGAVTGGAVTIDSDKLKNAPMIGNKDAKVTIVEFSDFECPFCERFYTGAYAQIKTEYIDTGKAKLYFMHFPLSFHAQAQKAAEAAQCAADQGKFWEMHDKMFENQASLSVENFKKWAKELNLRSSEFDSCLDSSKNAKIVADSEAYGQTLGVTGTPSFFVNGKSLVGAQPFSAFKQVIDAELAASA